VPDVVVAESTPAAAALHQQSPSTPVIFIQVANPVGSGFVASLAHPKGMMTGFTKFEPSMGGKWLELLKETAPRIKRAAALFNPETHSGQYWEAIEAAASTMMIDFVRMPTHDPAEIERAIVGIAREPNGGLIVMPDRFIVIFAPSYFSAHGRPRRPEELAHHQCIVRAAARDGNVWRFRIDGRTKAVKVAGRFRTNGALAANEAAVQGLGIARAPLWEVRPLLDRGAVKLTLTRFEPLPMPIQAVWPATRFLAAKTKLFVDFLAARLKNEQL
jgi:hypothetical protein